MCKFTSVDQEWSLKNDVSDNNQTTQRYVFIIWDEWSISRIPKCCQVKTQNLFSNEVCNRIIMLRENTYISDQKKDIRWNNSTEDYSSSITGWISNIVNSICAYISEGYQNKDIDSTSVSGR